MLSKYFRVSLLFLVLVSGSSFALNSKFGIPPQRFEYQYHYYDAIYNEVGARTYHCDGKVSQWGAQQGVYVVPVVVACD